MKLMADRGSRRKSSRPGKRSRRRSRTYAAAVPLSQRLGGLLRTHPSAAADSDRTRSDVASAGSRVLSLLLALSMTGVLVWFFWDYRFFVYAIAVDGAGSVNVEEVYQATGLEEMSVFYINCSKAADQVLERLTAVESASVSCALPARVQVNLQERLAAYGWQSGGYSYLVDEEGLVFRLDDGSRQDLVSIEDQDGTPLGIGDRVDAGVLRMVQQLSTLLPEATRFQYSEDVGVSLTREQGLVIYFGDERDLHTKVASAEAILREIASTGDSAQLIDVRFVGSPYYR
jgi:cell division septal protein FtsQ